MNNIFGCHKFVTINDDREQASHHIARPARTKNEAIIHTSRIKQKHLNLYYVYKTPIYRVELEYSELLSCDHSDRRSRTLIEIFANIL